jgi:hypothetical protein
MVGSNGGVFQLLSGPEGTTSVCPAKHSIGPELPRMAQKLSTSSNRRLCILKPIAASLSDIRFWQPASSGVTDAREIRSLAKEIVKLSLDILESFGNQAPYCRVDLTYKLECFLD